MNWYNELCANDVANLDQTGTTKPEWVTHKFKRMGRVLYGYLDYPSSNWIWFNEERTTYFTTNNIDPGSLETL